MGAIRFLPAFFVLYSFAFDATVLAAPVASIASCTNGVKVRPKDPSIPVHPAKVNEALAEGDLVSTDGQSSAKILFSDDTLIDVAPLSSFKIDKFIRSEEERVGSFRLFYGKIRALVTKAVTDKNKVEVKTMNAVMGVRGTEFVVSAPTGYSGQGGTSGPASTPKTEVTVLTGQVAMGLPTGGAPPVLINMGSQLSAGMGATQLSQPTPLTQSQLAAVSQGARVADNTYERTISLDAGTQNENAPAAATAKGGLASAITAGSEAVANAETSEVHGIGTFDALDSLTTTPVNVLPGNLQRVRVQLE